MIHVRLRSTDPAPAPQEELRGHDRMAAALKPRAMRLHVHHARIVGAAGMTGLLVFVLAGQIERTVITWAGFGGHRLEWISDLLAAGAVTMVTYLWLNLRESRSRLFDLERNQILFDEQLRLAAEIQQSLLPAHPPVASGIEWAARMEPALRVGGDFYDYLEREDGLLFVVGDVSGKGLAAALLQSALQTLFRTHAGVGLGPRETVARMSEGLRRQTGGIPYATAIVAHLDSRKRRLTYVNAGHPPGAVIRGGDAIPLSAGGPPLALLRDASYECGVLEIREGDLVALVTDGVTEPLGARWVDIVKALKPTDKVPDAVRMLLDAAGSAPTQKDMGADWQDDRTVLAVRVTQA